MNGEIVSNRALRGTLLIAALGGCATVHQPAAAPGGESSSINPRPQIAVAGKPYWENGFDAAATVALRNLHRPNAFHPSRHAKAAPRIRGVHLWDSAFLSQVWRAWDIDVAQEINQAVLRHARDGRVPHFSHRLLRSELTQPPVIAWAIWENFAWSPDTLYLSQVYPALEAYDAWLYSARRLPSGLFFWQSPLESGKDNTPRFDRRGRSAEGRLEDLAAVDLCSYMVLHSNVLARMAEVLQRPEESLFHSQRAAGLRELMNRLMWDEESGLYYDRVESTGELLKIRTAASLLPLFGGVPDSTRARRLRDTLMETAAFNSLLPIPTVALDDPSFSKDMWRGPVWINISYMIIRGLIEYGFSEDAADLAFRTIDGVYATHRETGGIWEFYDAERHDIAELSRKRNERLKQLTLGNKPLPEYGWSALVNTLLVEELAGFRREGERRWITPRLPSGKAGLQLRITLPSEQLTLDLEARDNGEVHGVVVESGIRREFVLAKGEAFELSPYPSNPLLARSRAAAP